MKKSIVLKAKHQGDAKVVLVKNYHPSSIGKDKKTEAATITKDAPSKAYKRKSFEMKTTKKTVEHCPVGKRRRSVPLMGATKPTVSLVQDSRQNTDMDLGNERNNGHMLDKRLSGNTMQASVARKNGQSTVEVLPSTTHVNETLEFARNEQQHDEMVDDFQDCVLSLSDQSGEESTECLVNSSKVRLDKHKSLLSMINLDSPQVKNSRKCKSLFETYHLNKVQNSIVDEM